MLYGIDMIFSKFRVAVVATDVPTTFTSITHRAGEQLRRSDEDGDQVQITNPAGSYAAKNQFRKPVSMLFTVTV